jgi:DNA-binding response OmpR family regulator
MISSPSKHVTRILVVQDDPLMLGLVVGSLRPEGHHIIEIANPVQALEIAERERSTLDLIIARVDSRPITGIELSKRLTRCGIDIPMLFISPTHTLAVVIAGTFGTSSVIEQPFTGAELRSSVKRCLSGHRRKLRREA